MFKIFKNNFLITALGLVIVLSCGKHSREKSMNPNNEGWDTITNDHLKNFIREKKSIRRSIDNNDNHDTDTLNVRYDDGYLNHNNATYKEYEEDSDRDRHPYYEYEEDSDRNGHSYEDTAYRIDRIDSDYGDGGSNNNEENGSDTSSDIDEDGDLNNKHDENQKHNKPSIFSKTWSGHKWKIIGGIWIVLWGGGAAWNLIHWAGIEGFGNMPKKVWGIPLHTTYYLVLGIICAVLAALPIIYVLSKGCKWVYKKIKNCMSSNVPRHEEHEKRRDSESQSTILIE